MELDVCPRSLGMGATGRNASQYGRIVENRMIEAIEVSATQLVDGPLAEVDGICQLHRLIDREPVV